MATGYKTGGRTKGAAKTGGRKRGSVNRFTRDLKELILRALETVGGEQYLVELARDNPASFATLLGKVLPMTVAGDTNAPLQATMEIVLVRPGEPPVH
jgi:hypothetical protein